MQTELIEQVDIKTTAITTTLFDLIGALNEEVGQEEDDRITATVVSLIQAGRLTFVRDRSAGRPAGVWPASRSYAASPVLTRLGC